MLRKTSLAAFTVMLCAYAGAQTPPQKPQAPDPTPPPRGTMSFPPVTDVQRQPLTPANFVTRAAIANLTQIELGQIALQKSEDPAVKALAGQMIEHHRAAHDELKAVAAQQHLSAPATVDEDSKKELQALSKLEDKAFDRKFLETMSADHDEAVALFDAARQTPELPIDLKSYASESLASIKEHRKAVQTLRGAEGDGR
jgi:predicted outer membrane protein